MKLFYRKQNLIDELKKARQIKAAQGFKISLYERLAEIDSDFLIKFSGAQLFSKSKKEDLMLFGNLFKKTPILKPLLLVAVMILLAGSGTGITLASQSALPGDILYPIKIASEKTRIILSSNNDEKAQLHFEFSSKRLEEIAELAKDMTADPKLTEIAVGNYKEELNKGQVVLFFEKSEEEAKRAANSLADITSKNKESIVKIGVEAKNYKIADSLKNAWEDTVEHSDQAVLITLKNDISQVASSSAVDSAREQKVIDKIAEAENKISETDQYLLKKKEKGIDIAESEAKINSAKELIGEANDLLNQNKYESAFNKAKEAYKAAASAQKAVEHINGDEDEEKLKMFRKYYDNQLEQGGKIKSH